MITPNLPIDEKVREKATKSQKKSVNVEAGAGTGKTTLLTHRYLSLLQNEKVTPLEIVAITFTEKAAYELKNRIRTALEKAKMEEALSLLERSPISTIHSFAASILRERPIEAGLDPNFEVMDELGEKIFMDEIYRSWFGTTLESKGELFSRAIASGIPMNRFFDLARDLYEHRDLLPHLKLDTKPPDILSFVQRFAKEVEDLAKQAETTCIDEKDFGFISIQKLRQATSFILNANASQMERAILFKFSISPSGNQKNWSPPDSLKKIKEKLKVLSEELDEIKTHLRASIFSDLLLTLQEFVSFVEVEKRKRGVLNFDDLLIFARDLLKSNPEVLSSFQDRFRFLLIDEFQDTDPLQVEFLWMLASKGKTLEPGKLFLVGDPKQSIYRFRRADLDTYRKATESVLETGERLVIRQNFRSTKPLVDWFNASFLKMMGEEYEPLHAEESHQFDENQKPVFLLQASEWEGGEKSRDVRLFEAEAIASLITNELIGKVKVWDGTAKALRTVQPKDIAILFPTTTGIDLFEEQLRRYELPFMLEGGRIFYHRTEIHGLINILDAIEHPTDAIAVVAALKSPFLGCSDVDILDLYQKAESFDYRKIDLQKLPRLTSHCLEILKSLHEARTTLLPSQVLQSFYEKAWVEPLTLTRTHGEQAILNIERFREMILNLERRGFLTLSKMVQWFRARSEEAEKQDETSVTDENIDRIHLMTIHKSKGLEFPVVILANLSGSKAHHTPIVANRLQGSIALGIGSKEARFATEGFETLKEMEEEKLFEEKKRLLYVAATRAKDLLILTKFLKNNRATDLWTLLYPGVDETKQVIHTIDAGTLPYQKRTVKAAPRIEESTPPQYPKREPNWIKGISIQNPSQMKLESTFQGQSQGAKVGSAIHEIFELLLNHPTLSVSKLCKVVAERNHLLSELDQMEQMTSSFQKSALFSRIQKAKRMEMEVPFTLKDGDSLIEGFIDLAFEEKDGWVIVDYKTDRVKKDNVKDQAAIHAPQMKLYSNAFSKITKMSVKEKLIYFVRSDKAVQIN